MLLHLNFQQPYAPLFHEKVWNFCFVKSVNNKSLVAMASMAFNGKVGTNSKFINNIWLPITRAQGIKFRALQCPGVVYAQNAPRAFPELLWFRWILQMWNGWCTDLWLKWRTNIQVVKVSSVLLRPRPQMARHFWLEWYEYNSLTTYCQENLRLKWPKNHFICFGIQCELPEWKHKLTVG